jgi:alpha-1,3-rhamnosyl/mannosyltransferase
MRVAVNLTWLTPGRVGGSEEYLTRQLLGVDPSAFEMELYAERAFGAAHPELVERFGLHAMPAAGNRAIRIALEHSWLPVRARGADVVHHGGGTMPLVGGAPTVLTVHDLQYLRHPEYFSAARRRYLAAMVPRSARRATVVTVPSVFVRDDLCEAFGVPTERVVVVPHGVPGLAVPDTDQVAAVIARYGLDGHPYVVYPAITHPHKGHAVLVEMLDHLDDETALVLIGGTGAAESALESVIRSSPHRDRVIRPGRVPDADRDALIAGADALVFPSEFEGFGAPVVEAMALDTPVVCSSADALVEVVGDAGVVVDEPTGACWAAAVGEARRARGELVARGHRRRGCFTIDASGAAISAAYRLAAS